MRAMTPLTASVDRRDFLRTGGLLAGGSLVFGSAFTAPSCGPSKEKAVRVAGFIIDLSKESLPLLDLLGSRDLTETVSTKVLPALEKLKDALANADIPTAGSTLVTVRNVLSGVANGLLNLPESARRTTVIGILASINVLLLTVQAFVESETASGTMSVESLRAPDAGAKMLKVLEATRQ